MHGITPDMSVKDMSVEQLDCLKEELTRNGEPEEGDLRYKKLAAVKAELARRVGVSGLGEGEVFHHPV